LLAPALTLAALLTACSGNESTPGKAQAGAGTGANGGAGASPMGGAGGSSGAAAGRGGSAPMTGGSGGSAAGAGGTSGAIAAAGAAGRSGTGGSSAGQAGGGRGGAQGGGAGGVAEGGRGGISGGNGGATGGTGNAAGCTRELLQSTLDGYFVALAAHDKSTLPLADTVKFTENGETMELGSAGLWKTAGELKYEQTALDTEQCMTASHAVVPDGGMDIPLALRLRLVNGKLTEIEHIAIHSGDYSVASNTSAMISADMTVHFDEPVPEDQRNSYEELTKWMDKYYRAFPQGVCNTASGCKRLENGGGNFDCAASAGCMSGDPMGTPKLKPRLILADEERGIGVGFTMFTGGYTDMHMFKMYGGKVYAVHAILGSAGSSGWD
jgi:hypothetical protein